MNAVVFDTLKLSQKLEAAGFTTAQAQGAAAAIADTFTEDLATRRDLKDLEAALRADIKELDAALRADIKALDIALRTDIKALDTALRTEMRELETRLRNDIQVFRAETQAGLRDLENRMTIRLGTMLAAAVVLVGAMVKLL